MGTSRKIIWAPLAYRDFKEAFEFIEADNSKAAIEWSFALLERIEKLSRFPQIGRIIPEIGHVRYRELVLNDYRIFHEVTDTEIRIFRIFHAKRLFPT